MFWLALSKECPSLTDVEDCSVSSINVSVLFVCHLLLAKFNQHLYCIYSFVNQQTLLPRGFFLGVNGQPCHDQGWSYGIVFG